MPGVLCVKERASRRGKGARRWVRRCRTRSCGGRVRSRTVRLGMARLPNRSGGRRLMVRWLEEEAKLLSVLYKRLHMGRSLA